MGETLQESINKYCEKYSVDNEGKEELIQLLNRSIIEISRGILDTHKTGNSSEVDSVSYTHLPLPTKRIV